MRILFVGDVFGEPGRTVLEHWLPRLIDEFGIDFVLANVDNAAGGKGITEKIAEELFKLPIDCMTAGNHVWEQPCIFPRLEIGPILRPHNIEEKSPGRGWAVVPSKKGIDIGVVHLQGCVFMEKKGRTSTSPFKTMDAVLKEILPKTKIILVDLHAEATAEKRALAWYLDGRVSAVVGTHTHVQTADEEILPQGAAFISDLGMTGPHQSVIGIEVETALKRFLSGGEYKGFKVAKDGVRLEGLVVNVDETTGQATSVKRIRRGL